MSNSFERTDGQVRSSVVSVTGVRPWEGTKRDASYKFKGEEDKN